MLLPKGFNAERGAIHYLILVAAIGLIGFLIISNLFSFKNKLFSSLFPKPPSHAAQGGWKHYDDLVKEGKIKPVEKILVVKLGYDVNASPKIKITDTKVKNGYASSYPKVESGYKLQVLDNQKNVVYSIDFDDPNNRYFPDIHPDSANSPDSTSSSKINLRDKNKWDLTLIIPWLENSAEVNVLDSNRSVLSNSSLANTSKENNKPDFYSLSGNKPTGLDTLKDVLIKKATATDLSNKLDITFIGDDFTSDEDSKFIDAAERYRKNLITYEPFKSRYNDDPTKSDIAFHNVLNHGALGCSIDGGDWGYIDCKYKSKAADIITSKGAPAEIIVIIYDTSTIAGTTDFNIVMITNLEGELANNSTHELGHAIGALSDEYVPKSFTFTFLPKGFNCSSSNHNSAWDGLTVDYRLGCTVADYYRSSDTSVMNWTKAGCNCYFFNDVSQKQLNKQIDFYKSGGTPTGYTEGGGTGTCADSSKPNGCTCTSGGQCATGYCSEISQPYICKDPPIKDCEKDNSCDDSGKSTAPRACAITGLTPVLKPAGNMTLRVGYSDGQGTDGEGWDSNDSSFHRQIDWYEKYIGTNTIQLIKYLQGNDSNKDHWTTTSSPTGYDFQESEGFIFSKNNSSGTLIPLYDCIDPTSDFGTDHKTNSSILGNCNIGSSKTIIGYLSPSAQTNTKALYWCEGNTHHDDYTSFSSNCGGSGNINHGILGYTLNSPPKRPSTNVLGIFNPVSSSVRADAGEPNHYTTWTSNWKVGLTTIEAHMYLAYDGSDSFRKLKSAKSDAYCSVNESVTSMLAPTVTNNTGYSCLNTSYSGDKVTISWTNIYGQSAVSTVLVRDLDSLTVYKKAVTGTSTSAPTGFVSSTGQSLVIQPGHTYSMRLYNGAVGPLTQFYIPSCPLSKI